jgi:hypothetical protein
LHAKRALDSRALRAKRASVAPQPRDLNKRRATRNQANGIEIPKIFRRARFARGASRQTLAGR